MSAIEHELAVQYVETSQLQQHEDNANSGDIEAIRDSIRVNGFFAPIIVQRKTKRILAGNHRFVAAISLGYSQVPVVYVEVSDLEAKRIMVADNRTARLGRDDEALLLDLLHELHATDDGLQGSGFDYDSYTELEQLAGGAYEPQPEPEESKHVEFDATPANGADIKKRLPYTLNPIVDPDGMCREFRLEAVGLGALTPRDLNEIRVAFGYAPLTRDEMRTYDVPRWHPKS